MHRRTLRTAAAATALLLTATLAACGSDDGEQASTDGTEATSSSTTEAETTSSTEADEPSSTTEAEESATTTPEENPEGVDTETSVLDSLPDGEHLGYIAGLEQGTVEGQAVSVIIFDSVELVTNDAGEQEIRNDVQTVIRIAVVPEAQVSSFGPDGTTLVPSSVDEVWRQQHLFRVLAQNVRDITTITGIEAVPSP